MQEQRGKKEGLRGVWVTQREKGKGEVGRGGMGSARATGRESGERVEGVEEVGMELPKRIAITLQPSVSLPFGLQQVSSYFINLLHNSLNSI